MNEHAILISVGIMGLFIGASITIGMTNIVSNESGLLFVEAQQQQNANVVSIGNCLIIGDNILWVVV